MLKLAVLHDFYTIKIRTAHTQKSKNIRPVCNFSMPIRFRRMNRKRNMEWNAAACDWRFQSQILINFFHSCSHGLKVIKSIPQTYSGHKFKIIFIIPSLMNFNAFLDHDCQSAFHRKCFTAFLWLLSLFCGMLRGWKWLRRFMRMVNIVTINWPETIKSCMKI